MAGELQVSAATGTTVYFLLRNATGSIWNGSTFVAYVTANYADYDIAATEQGTASGYFVATMPAVGVGVYRWVAKTRAGGSPVEGDAVIASGEINWTGSVVVTQATIAGAVWDEILTGATHNISTSAGRRLRTLQDTGNYQFGAVWINTASANTGSTFPDDGTYLNPVQSLANALTVAAGATQTIKRFYLLNSSSITLAQAFDGYSFVGEDWFLALGGQDINACHIGDATISGIATAAGGTAPTIHDCFVGDVTLPPCTLFRCSMTGTFTVGSAGDYVFDQCFDAKASGTTPIIDFGAAVGGTSISLRDWHGGVEVRNMKAGDFLSIDGAGRLVLASSCTAGEVRIRGSFDITNSGSGQTITDTAVWNETQTIGAISTDGMNALMDLSAGVETNRTPRQALRLMLAALAGELSGAAGSTVRIRDTNDSKDRIVATVDAAGNRIAVTYDAS